MISKLRYFHTCDVCRRTYRNTHICFGRAHRRRKSPVTTSSQTTRQRDYEQLSKDPYYSLKNSTRLVVGNCLEVPFERFRLTVDVRPYYNELPTNLKLEAKITCRKSSLMRLKGDSKGSELAIKTFLSSLDTRSDELTCGDLAPLHLSQANNHVYNFRFSEAHGEVKKWCPSSKSLSKKDEYLLWDQIFCVGRIMRGEGHFEEAKICFETCLGSSALCKPKHSLVIPATADLYCEMAYLQTENGVLYLSLAQEILKPEIDSLRQSSRQHLKGYRRLLLSLAEVKIRLDRHHEADILLEELLTIYSNLKDPNIVDRLGHVRAIIASARISPVLENAATKWRNALDWNRYYNPTEEEVFTCGVVHLCLCITWYRLGNIDLNGEYFWRAVEVLKKQQPQFLIPGVGTYLFHDVCKEVQSTAGWSLELPN